jgi:hypothetical protein
MLIDFTQADGKVFSADASLVAAILPAVDTDDKKQIPILGMCIVIFKLDPRVLPPQVLRESRESVRDHVNANL